MHYEYDAIRVWEQRYVGRCRVCVESIVWFIYHTLISISHIRLICCVVNSHNNLYGKFAQHLHRRNRYHFCLLIIHVPNRCDGKFVIVYSIHTHTHPPTHTLTIFLTVYGAMHFTWILLDRILRRINGKGKVSAVHTPHAVRSQWMCVRIVNVRSA